MTKSAATVAAVELLAITLATRLLLAAIKNSFRPTCSIDLINNAISACKSQEPNPDVYHASLCNTADRALTNTSELSVLNGDVWMFGW
jgi:hypothetical protein